MKRFEIQAKHKDRPDSKFMNLFADKRNYKTERYAKEIINKSTDWYPGLEFRVVQIELKTCPECGHTKEA